MQEINLGKIRFNWKGDYNATATYAQNDCIHFGGHALVCTSDNTIGVTPVSGLTANSPWQFMAKGVDVLTSKGDIVTFDGTNIARLGIGAKGQVLTVDENNLPSWQSQQARPATTVWLGSGLDKSGDGQSGLCQHHGGAYQSASSGTCNMSFIMSDQRRMKTLGRQLLGQGAQNRVDDVVIDFPQDAQFGDILLKGEYLVGHSQAIYYTVVWTNLGNVYVTGANGNGQLGLGDTNTRGNMTRIPYFYNNNIKIKKAIAVGNDQFGSYATYFIAEDGRVFATGFNSAGNLGNGITANQVTPVQCGSITGVTDLFISVAAAISVYAVNASGQLWVWGYNNWGQLGLGDTTNRTTPVLSSITGVKYVRTFATNSFDGTYWNTLAYNGAFLLKADGTVWACGCNGSYQLGLGDTTQRNAWAQVTGIPSAVRDLYVANSVSAVVFAICTNGLTYVFGPANGSNTLWQTDTGNRSTPVLFGMNTTNAAGWDQFWLVGSQRQNAAIGKRLDANGKATYWQIGSGITWPFGGNTTNPTTPQQIPIPENVDVVDVCLFSPGSTELGITAYFLLSSGEVMHAGNTSYSLSGKSSNANTYQGALSTVKF